MAKYCTQCNLKHSNSAEKCVSCGAELTMRKADVKKKKIIIISLISIFLIAAVIVGIVIFTGPKAKARQIMRNFKQGDTAGVVSSFPDFFVEEIGRDVLEADLNDVVQIYSDYIFSFAIQEVASPSSREKNNIIESLEAYEKFDSSKLKDIKIIWLDTKGGIPGFWGATFEKFILIKYDGSWYWWPFYSND